MTILNMHYHMYNSGNAMSGNFEVYGYDNKEHPIKYICIGGTSKKFKTKKLHPKEVAKLYGLNFRECLFFLDENRFKNKNHKGNKFFGLKISKNLYILRPRKPGDYIPHLNRMKAKRLLENIPL